MKYTGKIKKLDHIVLSDPMYKQDVWCRYENENINGENWFADIEINKFNSGIDNYMLVEFTLLLKKEKNICNFTEDDEISFSRSIKTNEYTIGTDSACVAFGINDKAKIINAFRDEWQPSCAIKTGTDGEIANVVEGLEKGKLEFLLLCGTFDENMCNEKEILEYLTNQFEITDLVEQKDDNKEVIVEARRELCVGDVVEVSTCAITNDVGGTTFIRNSNYKSEIDGMKVTTEYPDGTIKDTILESHDKLVDIPIEIEIIDGFYDYETGYRFKGKINNKKLKEELKKIGTTGYTPEDYKKYGESRYKEVVEASENYDPAIVYFSEFDIVKKLDKDNSDEICI